MFLITNFKTYESAIWENWTYLAQAHAKVRKESWKDISIAWHPLDLRNLLAIDGLPIYSQWADLAEYWSYTGKIPPIKLKKIWCAWVLINHSENRIEDHEVLEAIIKRCNELELDTIVCAETVAEWEKISDMWAKFVAVEPPELIWWDISVSKANPWIISDAVAKIWNGKVVIWAWIKTAEDITIAKQLWAIWILLASWITKAEDPEKVLSELASAL